MAKDIMAFDCLSTVQIPVGCKAQRGWPIHTHILLIFSEAVGALAISYFVALGSVPAVLLAGCHTIGIAMDPCWYIGQ